MKIKDINLCQKCSLHLNQGPLLDKEKECDVFWVGLSAKLTTTNEIPLSPDTNTGAIIEQIENSLPNVKFYKTNLVKCVPLDANKKLRYPTNKEINCCISNLQTEIDTLSPKVVILLGTQVINSVSKYLKTEISKPVDFHFSCYEINGIYYIPVHHPSYVWVYKRKMLNQYLSEIKKLINKLI